MVGKLIALSILHGGPGPIFFAPVIVDYLFGGMAAVHPTVDDVPDEGIRSKIIKVIVIIKLVSILDYYYI